MSDETGISALRRLSTWLSSLCQRLREVDARIMAEAETDRLAMNEWLAGLRREPFTVADLALTLSLAILVAALVWAVLVPASANHQGQAEIYLMFSA